MSTPRSDASRLALHALLFRRRGNCGSMPVAVRVRSPMMDVTRVPGRVSGRNLGKSTSVFTAVFAMLQTHSSPPNHDAAREGPADDLPGADARPQSSGIAANKFQKPSDQQQVPLEKTGRRQRPRGYIREHEILLWLQPCPIFLATRCTVTGKR